MTLQVRTLPIKQLLSLDLTTTVTIPANERGTATSESVSRILANYVLVIGRGEKYVSVRHRF